MAGVPIRDLVAGVSVGLVTQNWPKAHCGNADSDWARGYLDYGKHAVMLGERENILLVLLFFHALLTSQRRSHIAETSAPLSQF